MAKSPDKTTTEEKEFKAVAKDFIKYGGEHLKPGDNFEVKESDVNELKVYADIEIPAAAEGAQQDGNQEGKAGA